MRPGDPRRDAPATGRNRDPILEILRRVLPPTGRVLEIACGTGQHAVYFARALTGLSWLPTDTDAGSLGSARAWREHEKLPNLEEPTALDVTRSPWSLPPIGALFCANMIHISPWETCRGLMQGAGDHLPMGAPLVLYGPFKRNGAHTAPSNHSFDQSLRARDPRWGVRDLEAVVEEADSRGLRLEGSHEMPANNLTLVFRRISS